MDKTHHKQENYSVLEGSDDGELHLEKLRFWTLSIIWCSKTDPTE
jgi:hypothetical protein